MRRPHDNALARHICVVVITGDLGILAVVQPEPPDLNLDLRDRLCRKIKLLQVKIRLPSARPEARVVPSGGDIVTGKQSEVYAVARLAVELEPAANDELPLLLV